MAPSDDPMTSSPEALGLRTEDLFRADYQAILRVTDRLFAGLLVFQWLAAMVAALTISPLASAGEGGHPLPHVWEAVLLGGILIGPPVILALTRPGWVVTRHAVAVSQMLLGTLLIRVTGGRIETHFHVFGSLAFLAFYRDWRVLATASVVVAADHMLRGLLWPGSVYGVTFAQPWRWAERAGWVAFEDVFLIWSCLRGIREMHAIADRQARLEAMHSRIELEVERRTVELRESEARKATILETALDAVVTMDHGGRILEFNPAAETTFGYRREDVLGRSLADLIIPPAFREEHRSSLSRFLSKGDGSMLGRRIELPALGADGREFPVEMAVNPILRDGPPLFTAFVRDITDRKRAEQDLEYRALYDQLTGLPNRVDFQARLEQHLATAAGRPAPTAAILLVDLNHFKEINDTFGHHYGDIVLRRISPRLRDAVEGSGTVARLGGDEFGVLLPDAGQESASRAAEAILAALKAPVLVEGRALEVGASVGIALCPRHGTDPVALLQCADVAMYTAKRTQAGHLTYEPGQSKDAPRRLKMVGELRRGIDAGQLLLHFQPKVDLRTMRPSGAEALARWLHPRDGLLSPSEFIPMAENTGLIRPLGLWAIHSALLQCRAWHSTGLGQNVAVNLAADNLAEPGLVGIISELIAGADALPEWLTVEITESAMLADPKQARETLSQLRDLGIRIAIDDFGTGYSSLAYLRDLPVDEVKIDRSFITRLTAEGKNERIIRAIVDLGRALDLCVVAEGVEEPEALQILKELGCDFAQGFLFSRPLPPYQYVEWVRGSAGRLVPA